jgi:heme exporter protein C
MATSMLTGMLVMALAFWMYCFAVVLARVRIIILERERGSAWTRAHLPAAAEPA